MIRFFVDPSHINQSMVEFDKRDSHHIAVVLKMRQGQQIAVLDGLGAEYATELVTVAKTRCIGAVRGCTPANTEPRTKITVAQALPKSLDKLEWVLQHGTEVGVTAFHVFTAARGRDDAERLQVKKERWSEIVRTAAEQSHRAVWPPLTGISTFTQMLDNVRRHDLSLLAYENEDLMTLRAAIDPAEHKEILVVIGPERGFTYDEVRQARKAGVVTVSLGARILRTETAALVMASQILCICEPF